MFEPDITSWLEYFCAGMALSFDAVQKRAREAAGQGKQDQSILLRKVDARQRKVLPLFDNSDEITAAEVGKLFELQQRTARDLCQKWVRSGFLVISDPSKKARKYRLGTRYVKLLAENF